MTREEALTRVGEAVVKHATDAAGVKEILESVTALVLLVSQETTETALASVRKALDERLGK